MNLYDRVESKFTSTPSHEAPVKGRAHVQMTQFLHPNRPIKMYNN